MKIFIGLTGLVCAAGLAAGLTASSAWAGAHATGEQDAAAMLQEVLAGDHRSEANKARDEWRNPAETLAFFGLEPDMTVVEIWPSGGWYTEVIAPYIAKGGGKYYAAQNDPNGASERMLAEIERFKRQLSDPS